VGHVANMEVGEP